MKAVVAKLLKWLRGWFTAPRCTVCGNPLNDVRSPSQYDAQVCGNCWTPEPEEIA